MNPLECWTEEQRSAFLYRACAAAESGTVRAELFRRLAGEAEAQATIWRAQLTAKGHPAPPPFVPDSRAKLVAWLVRLLGPRPLKGVLAAMKVRGMAVYGIAAGAGPRPRATRGRRRRRASPPRTRRRRQPAGGGVRRQRRAGVEREPDSRRRGRHGRSAGRGAVRRRGHGRRRVRDGRRRISCRSARSASCTSTRSRSSATSSSNIPKPKRRNLR